VNLQIIDGNHKNNYMKAPKDFSALDVVVVIICYFCSIFTGDRKKLDGRTAFLSLELDAAGLRKENEQLRAREKEKGAGLCHRKAVIYADRQLQEALS
jgi:hypothetical protein